MRATLFALLAMGTAMAFDAKPAQAGDWGEAYCMRTYFDSDDCSYFTYRQCTATASGIGTYCFANPAFAYRDDRYEEPRPRRRDRRHAR